MLKLQKFRNQQSESEDPTFSSGLSEKESGDWDKPADDGAVAPEDDHYFWQCHPYTGGTCFCFRGELTVGGMHEGTSIRGACVHQHAQFFLQ